ncbi:MAG: SGNH/GDSL hydrolase family protein [Planctomycetota bacterium]|nr:SGNH/GDSL hydrolase family protein [Planctomycetota bacterium]
MSEGQTALWRRGLRGLGIALGTLVVLLGGTELVLRALGYASGPARYFDPRIGFRFHPNQERFMADGDGEPIAEVVFNELGLRGPVWSAPRRSDERRIACLGDSFTFGWGEAADDETWPARLQELLTDRPGLTTWTTMNFGVPGYNLWNSTRMYEHVARPFEPDLVLIGFFLNDVAPPDKGPRHTDRGLLYWAGRTALLQVFHAQLRGRISYFDNPDDAETKAARAIFREHQREILNDPDSEVAGPFWGRAMVELGELVDGVRADGCDLLLLCFPQRSQVVYVARAAAAGGDSVGEALLAMGAPQARLAGEAERLGVPYLDLLPAFARVGPSAYGELESGHPSARGYSAAAEAIAGRLEELGLLEGD